MEILVINIASQNKCLAITETLPVLEISQLQTNQCGALSVIWTVLIIDLGPSLWLQLISFILKKTTAKSDHVAEILVFWSLFFFQS